MWICLTEGFPFVLLPYELFAATSWQTAKTVVCTLWTMGMAVSCGIQIFLNRKYSFAIIFRLLFN